MSNTNKSPESITTAALSEFTMGEVKVSYPQFYKRCRDLFMEKFPNSVIDTLELYADFERKLKQSDNKKQNGISHTVGTNVVNLANQEKQELQAKMAKQFIEEEEDKIARSLETSLDQNEQNGVNNLILDNRIQDIKSLEIIDYHDEKIKQICSQLSSALSDLDTHMKVCVARKTELQRLLTAYEAFLKTTSPKKTTRKPDTKTAKTTKRKPAKKDDAETTSVLGRLSK